MSKHWKKDIFGTENSDYDPNFGFLDDVMYRFEISVTEISKNLTICKAINTYRKQSDEFPFMLRQIFNTTTKMNAIELYKLFEGRDKEDKSGMDSFSIHKYEYWLNNTNFEIRDQCLIIFSDFKKKIKKSDITSVIKKDIQFRNEFLAHWDMDKSMMYQYELELTQKIVTIFSELILETSKLYDKPRSLITHGVENDVFKLLKLINQKFDTSGGL